MSYGEWCHVVGLFQSLLFLNARNPANVVVDIGCGTGLLAVASEPVIGASGHYIGIDVSERDVTFCRNHYPADRFRFQHLDTANRRYAPDQPPAHRRWDIENESVDLLTALSVWTHLTEVDARFYFREIDRVLKPGGRALLTFFLLDEDYHRSLEHRSEAVGRYHNTRQDRWVFDVNCPDSHGGWFHPTWATRPEDAVGITSAALDSIMEGTRLRRLALHPGNWKERPGLYFQDIVVFEKGSG